MYEVNRISNTKGMAVKRRGDEWFCNVLVLVLLMIPCRLVFSANLTHLQSTPVVTSCLLNTTLTSSASIYRGGLSSMVKMAAEARSSLELAELPLKSLEESFQQINSSLSDVPNSFHSALYTAGVAMAVKAFYSASFALVLGLSVPLVLALLMWLLPKLCPPAEELGEEEGETTEGNERGTSFEEKNSSMESQLVLWLLMLGALLSAVLLVIFLSLSLTGSVWVTSGVSKASLAARDIIPELSSLQQGALTGLNSTLVDTFRRYELYATANLNNSLSVLGETEVSNSAREQISRLLQEVHEAITDLKTTMLPALEHTIGNISLVVAYSEGLEQVRSAVVTLASSCEDHLRSATTGELSQLCSILVQQREEYIPLLSPQYIQELVGIRSLLSTQYLPPVQLLSESSIQVDGVEDYATRLVSGRLVLVCAHWPW